MSYSRISWTDNTPISVGNLNIMDLGIETLSNTLDDTINDIGSIDTRVTNNEEDINTNTTNIAALDTTLTNLIIVRKGTFTGTVSVSLLDTLGITQTYGDYTWYVSTGYEGEIGNNASHTLTGSVTAGTLNLSCLVNNVAASGRYVLTGIKNTVCDSSTVNI
jgi:hypothetical protein